MMEPLQSSKERLILSGNGTGTTGNLHRKNETVEQKPDTKEHMYDYTHMKPQNTPINGSSLDKR